MGQHCHFKCMSFPFKRDDTLPQWAFKLNSDPPTEENWHLEGHMLKVKECLIMIEWVVWADYRVEC
jgi:hypothetical protein